MKIMEGYKFKLLVDTMCYNDAVAMGARAAYAADFWGELKGEYQARKWKYCILWLDDYSAANLWRVRADGIKEEVGVFYLVT